MRLMPRMATAPSPDGRSPSFLSSTVRASFLSWARSLRAIVIVGSLAASFASASAQIAPIDGDECLSALVVDAGETFFDTAPFTTSSDPIDVTLCPFGVVGAFVQDVWFVFTPLTDGLLTASLCDSADFDTDLAVYAGTCGALDPIGCNGDINGCGGFTSEVADLPVTGGVDYFVRIGGWEPGDFGTGTLVLTVAGEFLRGDTNGDGQVDIADAVASLAYLFTNGPARCLDALDTNDDGVSNIADAVFTLTFLFSGGPNPPAPHPVPGPDPTADGLGCAP